MSSLDGALVTDRPIRVYLRFRHLAKLGRCHPHGAKRAYGNMACIMSRVQPIASISS